MNRRKFLQMSGLTAASTIAPQFLVGCKSRGELGDRLKRELFRGQALAAGNGGITQHDLEAIALRAMLRTIYWSEGTYPNPYGLPPYNIIFGYSTFEGYGDHPRQCIPIPGHPQGWCSDAAGIGQFISPTYDSIYRELYPQSLIKEVGYFHPKNQDLAIALLLGETGAYWEMVKGISFESGKVVVPKDSAVRAIWKAGKQWASIPLEDGSSIGAEHGGQQAYPLEQVYAKFEERLNDF